MGPIRLITSWWIKKHVGLKLPLEKYRSDTDTMAADSLDQVENQLFRNKKDEVRVM